MSAARTDVFIVGGGPAGLVTAIAARRRGMRVMIADGIVPPADKACGEGLLPDALASLAALGVNIPAADSFAFRGIRFIDRETRVEAAFPAAPARGVRRTTLHRILVEHAASVGVEMHWGAPVDFDAIRAGWIIGADGEGSLLRRWAGLDVALRAKPRFGFRRHYRMTPWTDFVELYWGDGCQIYITPVSGDSICVAGISRDAQFRLADALRQFPDLARRLHAAEVVSSERGAASYSRTLPLVYRNRIALVGDASGSVDAITGEGLCLAFRQGVALAKAMERGDLSEYQREHRRIARRPQWMAKALLAMGDHAVLRGGVMRSMAAMPGIFAALLALHTEGPYEIDHLRVAAQRRGFAGGGDDSPTRPGPDACHVHAQ